ncbi:flagellar basal body P-ring formation chaperone FlgA [uncultured Umboniibacter sp.]|uniref:flagellar basal body P-ring formation chaperone FlgA n=1 Tax=uncultured Umboniibacter sp. TaxID=1798917 RepID=UPI00260D451C|nr:flagellar basal body P-ring formation chaperone FlgA [uncultured Umboniibacter sp.]
MNSGDLILFTSRRAIGIPIPLLSFALAALLWSAHTVASTNLSEVQKSVEGWVAQQVQDDLVEQHLELVSFDLAVRLPPALSQVESCEDDLIFRFATDEVAWKQRSVTIECLNNSQRYRLRSELTLEVQVKVWVARFELPRNHLITQSDLEQRVLDAGQLRRGFVTDVDHIVGMETLRRVRSSNVFHPSELKSPSVAKRGDEITVYTRSGGLEVEVLATALDNGALGDEIRARNLSTGAVFKVELIGERLAIKE